MKLVWSAGKNPMSWLIRLITGEKSTHFSIVFMSRAHGLMFHSNLLGPHPKFFESARKKMEIIHEEDLNLSTEEEDIVWTRIIEKYDGMRYDIPGSIGLGWFKLRERIFGIHRPSRNPFNRSNAFFCDEIYGVLNGIKNVPVIDAEAGLITPEELWEEFRRGRDALSHS